MFPAMDGRVSQAMAGGLKKQRKPLKKMGLFQDGLRKRDFFRNDSLAHVRGNVLFPAEGGKQTIQSHGNSGARGKAPCFH